MIPAAHGRAFDTLSARCWKSEDERMMPWIMAAAILTSSPEVPPTRVVTTEAVREIGPLLQTGTLIFSRGDCLAIKVFSAGQYTHVASVVVKDDTPVVYDSTGGPGVRCLPLDEYLASQGAAPLYVLQPREAFTAEACEKYEAHLKSQLGRPYSVKHHVTGQRVKGLHCAEFATDALVAAGLIKVKCPPRVSPASLRAGLVKGELYEEIAHFQLIPPLEPVAAPSTWYARMWDCTCTSTIACWRKMRGCVLCY